MKSFKGIVKADGLLLTTAIIWGFSFVALRSSMKVIGPFAFSAARFALGTLSLLPLLVLSKRQAATKGVNPLAAMPLRTKHAVAWAGLVGSVLFVAVSLQQIGLVYTTAGNAGFITSLFVILVPVIRYFHGKSSGLWIWVGAVLAVTGLYFLCVGSGFRIAHGDLLELAAALFWTGHILLINRLVTRMEALEIAVGQFATCTLLSFIAAYLWEPTPFAGVLPAAIPILYGGLFSIGIAYTLQIVAQKTAHPTHASIILSMQALFAGVGGVLLLNEPLSLRLILGGALMLTGMAVSQLEPKRITRETGFLAREAKR